jgi:hypothetical protein
MRPDQRWGRPRFVVKGVGTAGYAQSCARRTVRVPDGGLHLACSSPDPMGAESDLLCAPEGRSWPSHPTAATFLMNLRKCGSNSSPLAATTSSNDHQRAPRNSTSSIVILISLSPSHTNHKLTSVWPASGPMVVVTVTNHGCSRRSAKFASIPSSSRHSRRAAAAGCSSGSTCPPGGSFSPKRTWSTSKTS